MTPRPIRPIYAFGDPGAPVDLYVGNAELNGVPVDELEIWMSARRGLDIRWRVTTTSDDLPLGMSTLQLDHPEFGVQSLQVHVLDSDGLGFIPSSELRTSNEIERVLVHWVNVPAIFPAALLEDNGHQWSGHWEVRVDGWVLRLNSRRDLTTAFREARHLDEEFLLTHTGEVQREDGRVFEPETAADVLFGWQLAMSFALGRWVAPSLPVGLDGEGRRIWEQWAPWRCDTLTGYLSWWDTHTSDDLASFLAGFLRHYLDPDKRPVVRHVAMHVIAANHAGTTGEAKVMLAQAGLEYLSWVDLRLTGRMTRAEYKGLQADEKLRVLLSDAGIPASVPTTLDALAQAASDKSLDGPGVVTWLRNRLVHPKDPSEPYRLENLVWQAAQLFLEYGELLLLHRVGYEGLFGRRYPPGRFAHVNEPVPWAR